MLLPIRPIAMRCAVYFFFAVAILGTFSGIPAVTCSKRGMVGARYAKLKVGHVAAQRGGGSHWAGGSSR